ALARGVKVIPVLIDGAPMPSARDLPEPLAALARHQALDLRTTHLEQDAERLGLALERLGAGRNAVTWLSLLTRPQLALDPVGPHKPEVLWRALRFLLYMGGVRRDVADPGGRARGSAVLAARLSRLVCGEQLR